MTIHFLIMMVILIQEGLDILEVISDVYAACRNLKEGIEFVKKPDDGNMKGLAFIKIQIVYWIEILSASTSSKF